MDVPAASARCPIIQCCLDERDLNKDYGVEHIVLGDAGPPQACGYVVSR